MMLIAYALIQLKSWIIGAWIDRLWRYALIAVVAIGGCAGVKTYLQAGMVPQAELQAAAERAKAQAALDRVKIEEQRDASEQADAAQAAQWAAQQQEARRVSETATDPIVIPAGDGWLRGKAGSNRH